MVSGGKRRRQYYFLFLGLILVLGLGFLLFVLSMNFQKRPEHLANYQKDEFYQNFFSRRNTQAEACIGGLIVPHHLFAASLIEKAFALTQSKRVKQVIVIGPNHGEQGHGLIITSLATWKTNFGFLKPAQNSIRQLTKDGLVLVEEAPFQTEHSIYNLLPYIKLSFPNAKVVPLILKARTNQKMAEYLAQRLLEISDQETIVIASLDFSHFQTPLVAAQHDQKSIKVISGFQFEEIYSLDVDSPPTLYAFLKYLQLKKETQFNLLENTNSGFLVHRPEIKETTSYITGYFRCAKN